MRPGFARCEHWAGLKSAGKRGHHIETSKELGDPDPKACVGIAFLAHRALDGEAGISGIGMIAAQFAVDAGSARQSGRSRPGRRPCAHRDAR